MLTALAMVLPWPAGLGRPWLRWAAAVLLGAGPFIAYVASRTVGMPGDPGDVGNWGDWVGTVSLFVEAALVLLSASMLLALRHTTVTLPWRSRCVAGRTVGRLAAGQGSRREASPLGAPSLARTRRSPSDRRFRRLGKGVRS